MKRKQAICWQCFFGVIFILLGVIALPNDLGLMATLSGIGLMFIWNGVNLKIDN
ncbi:MAG: hypothetical protein WC781_05245 [Candidatus Pacearchaeota archaeon]|jgi:hypothetical protein